MFFLIFFAEELVQERAKFKAVANQLDLTYHELHGC